MSRWALLIAAAMGYAALGAAPPAAAAPDAMRGEAIYARCQACHALSFDRVGPRHCGLLGRPAGSVPDYGYSAALKRSAIVWDEKSLDRFLAAPMKAVPGTSMPLLACIASRAIAKPRPEPSGFSVKPGLKRFLVRISSIAGPLFDSAIRTHFLEKEAEICNDRGFVALVPKGVAIRHIAQRTDELARSAGEAQVRAMQSAATTLFREELQPVLQRLAGSLQEQRRLARFESWLTHVAAALLASALSWAIAAWMWAR